MPVKLKIIYLFDILFCQNILKIVLCIWTVDYQVQHNLMLLVKDEKRNGFLGKEIYFKSFI